MAHAARAEGGSRGRKGGKRQVPRYLHGPPIGRAEAPKHRHGMDGPRLAIKAIDTPNATSTPAAAASPRAAVAGNASRAAITTSSVIRNTAPVPVRRAGTTFSSLSQPRKPPKADLLRTFDTTETEKTVPVMTRAHNSR
jgi:hypothetical protein